MDEIAGQKPLGLAMIGAGMVAATHLRAIRALVGRVTLVGVMARQAASAQALIDQADWDVRPKVYASLADVARDPAVDIAVVVAPPNARLDVIAPLADAGQHILLEKPVARTAEEAAQVVALCDAANVRLGVFFQHRMREASRAAQTLVASGDLGSLGLVEVAVPWWREQSYYDDPGRGTYARDGGGVLISQAIHTLDLALSLAGPVVSVQAMTATTRLHDMEAEDFATAGLRFANGAVGSVVASTAAYPGKAETIVLHFERASLTLDSGVLRVAWRDGRVETVGGQAGTGGGADPMAFTHEWHQGIIEDFVDALHAGRPPIAPGAQALAVHRLITAIETSARTGQRTEVLP
ncbi:dehydrogenase [Jannaschia pagri]|uniref:Dehydrogenase n=1 Tax=Jannaschia pagri TaxID=2829797 RepID=A0ABQ4NHI3_9RHOB|nr:MULTISPECIES: Gfo/Idh/MocA family oxidoreductase [unclassified Jannaschia]GIT90001.1 dehydrogenase [Jannaschia sp. AI_61]GIT93893.1 dehydrogenase [Jannaschia sp. AI_62]